MTEIIKMDQALEIFTQKITKIFTMGEVYFHPKPGDTVLDIGSCTGDMTLYYSWRVGDTGKVYSIEPDRKFNLKNILYLIKGINNVYLCNLAISNFTGETPLYLSVDSSHHTIKKDFLWSQEPDKRFELNVKTYTLDDFVEYVKTPKVDFIYMNIEGSELDVLEKGEKTLLEMQPKIYIAPHEVAGENLKEKVMNKLQDYSYFVKEYNGAIYASPNHKDLEFIPSETCHKCGKSINEFEDHKYYGTCLGCYMEFLHQWMSRILGIR